VGQFYRIGQRILLRFAEQEVNTQPSFDFTQLPFLAMVFELPSLLTAQLCGFRLNAASLAEFQRNSRGLKSPKS
jgi:hypothetical protein